MNAGKDRWPELKKLVSHDDGLLCRECGPWTEEKLWFWHRYLEITTGAMVGHPNWRGGLCYVDLFSGPGVCRVREKGVRLPGSPLLAAHAAKAFRRIILVELGDVEASALEARMLGSPASDRFRVIRGDCNEAIQQVVDEIPAESLTLAFIDPEGLDVHFETLRTLVSGRAVDFLLLFADAVEAVRNADFYESMPESKLDAMLGPDSGWREAWAKVRSSEGAKKRALFPTIYERQIKSILGYRGFRSEVINGPSGPLYRLIYASKHERGLEFWDKVTKRALSGQAKLF